MSSRRENLSYLRTTVLKVWRYLAFSPLIMISVTFRSVHIPAPVISFPTFIIIHVSAEAFEKSYVISQGGFPKHPAFTLISALFVLSYILSNYLLVFSNRLNSKQDHIMTLMSPRNFYLHGPLSL